MASVRTHPTGQSNGAPAAAAVRSEVPGGPDSEFAQMQRRALGRRIGDDRILAQRAVHISTAEIDTQGPAAKTNSFGLDAYAPAETEEKLARSGAPLKPTSRCCAWSCSRSLRAGPSASAPSTTPLLLRCVAERRSEPGPRRRWTFHRQQSHRDGAGGRTHRHCSMAPQPGHRIRRQHRGWYRHRSARRPVAPPHLNDGKIEVAGLGIAKIEIEPRLLTAFFCGILCNPLVCLAVWLAMGGRSVTDKVVALVLPISAFVAAGFEHGVAHMDIIPLGIMVVAMGHLPAGDDASSLTLAGAVRNLIPVTLSDIVGGSVLVAFVYHARYHKARSDSDTAKRPP